MDRHEGTAMWNLEDLIREASGGKARLLTGADAKRLLEAITSGDVQGLGDVLGLPNCGQDDCPLHGETNKMKLSQDDVDNMSGDRAWELGMHMLAATHNAIIDNDDAEVAELLQRQTRLWFGVSASLGRSGEVPAPEQSLAPVEFE